MKKTHILILLLLISACYGEIETKVIKIQDDEKMNFAVGALHFYDNDTGFLTVGFIDIKNNDNTNVIKLVLDAGIKKTCDGGKTWNTKKIGEGFGGTAVVGDFIYIIRRKYNYTDSLISFIDVSKDKGDTFKNVYTFNGSIEHIYFLDEKTGVFFSENRVYKTFNGGTEWVLLNKQNVKKTQLSYNENLLSNINLYNIYNNSQDSLFYQNLHLGGGCFDKDSLVFSDREYLTSLNLKTGEYTYFEKLPESKNYQYIMHKNKNNLFVVCKTKNKEELKLYQRNDNRTYRLIKTFKSNKVNFHCTNLYTYKSNIFLVTTEDEIWGDTYMFLSYNNGKSWGKKKLDNEHLSFAFNDNSINNRFKVWIYDIGWKEKQILVIE